MSQNHFTPIRRFLHTQQTLCRYISPTSTTAYIQTPEFLNRKLEARRTSYYIQGFSKALNMNPIVNANFIRSRMPFRGGHLHAYERVAAAVSIDKKFGDQRFPFYYVFQDSHKMTIKEIDEQLKFAIEADVQDIPQFKRLLDLLKLPFFLQKEFMKYTVQDEDRLFKSIGTFNLTNVSSFNIHAATTLCPRLLVAVGKHSKESIPVTYGFNHVIFDGAQIGKFHQDAENIFKNLDFN